MEFKKIAMFGLLGVFTAAGAFDANAGLFSRKKKKKEVHVQDAKQQPQKSEWEQREDAAEDDRQDMLKNFSM